MLLFTAHQHKGFTVYLVVASWVVTVAAMLFSYLMPISQWTTYEFMQIPLVFLSSALFILSLGFLRSDSHNAVIAHYEALDAIQEIQRLGILSLLLLPFFGTLSMVFLFQIVRFAHYPHPIYGLAQILLIYAVISPLLWQISRRWLLSLSATALAIACTVIGLWLGAPPPSLWPTLLQIAQLAPLTVSILLAIGLSLRWFLRHKAYRSGLQLSAIALFCVSVFAQIAILYDFTQVIVNRIVALIIAVSLLVGLLGLGCQSLRCVCRLWLMPVELEKRDIRPYLLGGSFPLALLLAMASWLWHPQPTANGLLILAVAQLCAFSAFCTFYATYRTEPPSHPHAFWFFLRPILIFIAFFFPFGFPSLSLLRAIW